MGKSRAEVREYFHGDVDLGTSPSADYVIAHSDRQRQRGRKPSVNYRNFKNPQESLAAAKADIDLRNSDNRYTAGFSGRVAVIRFWSDQQEKMARNYGEHILQNNNAAGVLLKEIEDDEVLQAPLHFRPTGQGTVEVMIPLQNVVGN